MFWDSNNYFKMKQLHCGFKLFINKKIEYMKVKKIILYNTYIQ